MVIKCFRGIVDLDAFEFSFFPLSVNLIKYTAQAEGARAKLKWTTATESNNKAFIISCSADGKNFKESGSVVGAGMPVQKKIMFSMMKIH